MRVWVCVALGLAALGGLAACSAPGRLTGSSDVQLVGGDVLAMPDDAPPAGAAPVASEPPAAPAPQDVTVAPPAPPAPAPMPAPTPVVVAPAPGWAPPAPCAPVVCAPCNPCKPCCEPVKFCNPCDPPAACSPGYVGGVVALGPGLGAGFVAGVPIKKDCMANWFLEASLTYQDLSAFAVDEKFSGKFVEALVGLKLSLSPDTCWHPTARAMVGWFVATGDPAAVDIADIPAFDDYFGGYLSIGFEYDVSRRFTTGPELGAFLGFGVDDFDFAFVPQLRWNFIFNF